jgi:D-3-phosphoglycerate dehydrogenase
MKVLVATEKPFAAAAVEGIKKEIEGAGNELVLLEKYTEKAQLLDAVKDVDAMIIRSDKADAEVLDAAKNLKIIVRAGAGYDNIDLAAATAHNVVAENTPGQNSNAVAELVFGLLVFTVLQREANQKFGFSAKQTLNIMQRLYGRHEAYL